jgi:DNA-directed RNA polymerase subunit M/transcription elongation factor TFIIS
MSQNEVTLPNVSTVRYKDMMNRDQLTLPSSFLDARVPLIQNRGSIVYDVPTNICYYTNGMQWFPLQSGAPRPMDDSDIKCNTVTAELTTSKHVISEAVSGHSVTISTETPAKKVRSCKHDLITCQLCGEVDFGWSWHSRTAKEDGTHPEFAVCMECLMAGAMEYRAKAEFELEKVKLA